MTQEDNSNSNSSPQKARKIGMLTDVGQVRTVDEDSILAADLSFGVNSKSSDFHLLVVADGMGGHAKGEEASKIALSAISRSVIPELVNDTPFTKLLEQGIQNANQDILDYTAKHPRILWHGNYFCMCNSGRQPGSSCKCWRLSCVCDQ